MSQAVYRHPQLFPDTHILVAEVDVIQNARQPDRVTRDSIATAIYNHKTSGIPYVWSDGRADQFVDGISQVNPQVATYLVDIEPLMRHKDTYDSEMLIHNRA